MVTKAAAWLVAIILLGFSGCTTRSYSQESKAAEQTTVSPAGMKQTKGKSARKKPVESWQPFDLSILFPIDSTVPQSESGYCNLPSARLPTVAGTPLVPRKFFNRIVDEGFGLESYVKAPKYTERRPGPQTPMEEIDALVFKEKVQPIKGKLLRKKQLKDIRKRFAEGKYPHPVLCGRAENASGIGKVTDAIALASGAHLAQLRQYSAEICDYRNWRVTALRFDLCLEQSEIKNFMSKSAKLPAECLTQEFRVTLKPVYSVAQRVMMENLSIKLVFYLGPEADASLIADLRKLRTATRMATSPDVNDGALKPHPGLVAEQKRCHGPIANSVRSILQRYGLARNLVAARYSGINRDLNRMSLGVVPFYQARPESMDELDRVNSFSLVNLDPEVDARPYSDNLMASDNAVIHGFAKPFRHPGRKLRHNKALEVGRRIISLGNKVKNPALISQFPIHPKTHGTDCLSCHMTKVAQDNVRASVANPDQVSSLAFRYYSETGGRIKTWFGAEAKTVGQMDNFGYYYKPRKGTISYKISERVVNETDNQRRLIEKFFPEVR